jgi:hypothetical protein
MDSRFVISSYHNYMVNGLLVAGFQIGAPAKGRFFFRADPMEPEDGNPTPLISANLFDSLGEPFLRIADSLVMQNPGSSRFRKTKAGLSIRTPDGAPFFAFETIAFRNTYYTRFAGTLYDERGKPAASGVYKDFTIHVGISTL